MSSFTRNLLLSVLFGIILFLVPGLFRLLFFCFNVNNVYLLDILIPIITLSTPVVLGYFYSFYFKKKMDVKIRDKAAITWALLQSIFGSVSSYDTARGMAVDIFGHFIAVLIATILYAALMFWFMGFGTKYYFKK